VCLHCLYYNVVLCCDIRCGLKFSFNVMLTVTWYVVMGEGGVTYLGGGGAGEKIG
jgi:hypothetical protein